MKRDRKSVQTIGILFWITFFVLGHPFAQNNTKLFVDSLEQADSAYQQTEYPILLFYEHGRQQSMRMPVTNYPTIWRFGYRYIDEHTTGKSRKGLFTALFLGHVLSAAYPHEQGHRSVLTNENIGSVPIPLFDKNLVAKVTGVEDNTLRNLGENDLPTYIRLHTGGLETDYLILKNMNTLAAFQEDKLRYVLPEIGIRLNNLLGYHLTALIPSFQPSLNESDDELENDIVGHDIYGMVKHIHHPQDSFYRYVRYEHLNQTELKYLRKIAYSSLFNLLSPVLLRHTFQDGSHLALGSHYHLTPFGDMLDITAWYKSKSKDKYQFSLHKYDNNAKGYLNGWGVYLQRQDWQLGKANVFLDLSATYFHQPTDLDFNTPTSEHGGALEAVLFCPMNNKLQLPISLQVGFKWKSKGYIPGDNRLTEGTLLQFGFSIQNKL